MASSPATCSASGGPIVERHEHEAGEGPDPGREQAGLLFEAGEAAALRDADQRAVGAVGPPVVGAADRLAAVAAALAQPGGPVAADVAEGAGLAVLAAHDEHRLGPTCTVRKRAGPGEVRDVAPELPGTGEDGLLLAGEGGWIDVETGLESEGHVGRLTL